MAKKNTENSSEAVAPGDNIRCRYCGQKNQVREDYVNNQAVCGRCRLPLSERAAQKVCRFEQARLRSPGGQQSARRSAGDSGH